MNKKEDKANRRVCKNSSFGRLFTILVIVVISIFVLLYLILISLPPRGRPDWVMCAINVSGLGKALYLYRSDYDGQYPTADKWCDLLVSFSEMKPNQFVCRGSDAKIGESSYSLNKNIAGKKYSEVPPDIVLLFESKSGWNQVGGPELLTTENHKGEGCNILFNDMQVEFVKAERIAELKWDIEKKDSESIE